MNSVSKEANSSELFSLLLLLPEHSGASALANCCNIWDCQTLGCIKKHELYCCLHVAYGKQGMSTWTTMYFILSAVRQGSKNVGLVGEKLSKDKKLHGWELWKFQGSFWKNLSNFWSLPKKRDKYLVSCYSKNCTEMLAGLSLIVFGVSISNTYMFTISGNSRLLGYMHLWSVFCVCSLIALDDVILHAGCDSSYLNWCVFFHALICFPQAEEIHRN